jgi:hypothetical protein
VEIILFTGLLVGRDHFLVILIRDQNLDGVNEAVVEQMDGIGVLYGAGYHRQASRNSIGNDALVAHAQGQDGQGQSQQDQQAIVSFECQAHEGYSRLLAYRSVLL